MSDDAIGVFDSGVGGLTVVREVMSRLPHESITYLGDTARVPYGTKSPDTVRRYASACARVLTARNIKLLVVACNTASAHGLAYLQEELTIPVLGVVRPGAELAVRMSRDARIGVIGTAGTIASGAYQAAIAELAPNARVYVKACPLFVPLAEEGWTAGDVPARVAASYLAEFQEGHIDTLLLGCTHYPLLRDVIADTVGDSVRIVDSAEATAGVVDQIVGAIGAHSPTNSPAYTFLVSDSVDGFRRTGERFLGNPIQNVEWVDF